MNTLVNVKRATKNQLVKADVTGTNQWVVGRILDFDKTHITFIPSDGSEFVKIVRNEVYKATEEEFKAGGVETKSENVVHVAKKESVLICPHCGIDALSNGLLQRGDEDGDGKIIKFEKHEYICMACDNEFGPEFEQTEPKARAKTDLSGYVDVRAASGRKSKDIGDMVAQMLRGKTLDEAYTIVAAHMELSRTKLKAGYKHLNDGQQRMCLGNKLRAFMKKSK